MEGGESQEVADALAKWAWGAPSLTALHPEDTPEGGLDFPNVRAPDGEWAPRKDIESESLLFREAKSPRARHIACANSQCFRGRTEYCMAPPPQERRKEGPVIRRHHQGMPNGGGAGGDAKAGGHSRAGDSPAPRNLA